MNFKNRLFWIAALISLILDRLTKYWVVTTFDLTNSPQTLPVWQGVFHFTYVLNDGAAYSLFKGAIWLRWLSLAVSLFLITLALLGPVFSQWEQIGFGFLLGGALGNGIDRFISGKVVDFIDFRLIGFPVFNLADVFINVGIVCLIIASLQKPSPSHRSR